LNEVHRISGAYRRGQGEGGARKQHQQQVIVSWTLDPAHYRVVPTMSDGTAGAPLELRGLFEMFLMQTQGWS
jgi:hypothetical protein